VIRNDGEAQRAQSVQNMQTSDATNAGPSAGAARAVRAVVPGAPGGVGGDAVPTKQGTVVNDASDWSKTPRNAPCPCGSGKKYKQCHGKVA